jgi:hypothetical protein
MHNSRIFITVLLLAFTGILLFAGSTRSDANDLVTLIEDHIHTFQPVKLSLANTEAVDIHYLHLRGSQEIVLNQLTNSSTLQAHDSYGIVFTAANSCAECFVYIFQVYTTGKLVRIFPAGSFDDIDMGNINPVRAGQKYYVPARTKVFELGNPPALSDLYVIVSPHHASEVVEYYEAMLLAQAEGATRDEDSYRAEILRILHAQEGNMSHITPNVYGDWLKHEVISSPVRVRDIVTWFSFKESEPSSNWIPKGVVSPDSMPKATLFDLFEERSAILVPEAYPILYEYGKALQKELSGVSLKIAAYTDEFEDQDKNVELSRLRAGVVKEYLTNKFAIADQRLQTAGYATGMPLSQKAEKDRQFNNRIEFIRIK